MFIAGVAIEDQRLIFGTRQLADDANLAEAGVSDESAMYVLLRLLGGAKKRKKKTYTKPKKIKHKHKKVKLAVLNFYKVSHLRCTLHTTSGQENWKGGGLGHTQKGVGSLTESRPSPGLFLACQSLTLKASKSFVWHSWPKTYPPSVFLLLSWVPTLRVLMSSLTVRGGSKR